MQMKREKKEKKERDPETKLQQEITPTKALHLPMICWLEIQPEGNDGIDAFENISSTPYW